MAAIRSATTSAAAPTLPLHGCGGHRLPPCVAAPARHAPGAAVAPRRLPRSALRASVSPAVTIGEPDESVVEPLVEAEPEAKLSNLACPICYYPLASSIDQSVPSKSAAGLECSTCKKVYPNKEDYWDLTVAVGSTEYSESMPAATELFRTPLVSFLYERGWRQNFIWGGFPGLEREFEMAKTYLKPTTGGIIVDASCGSGLFSRLFVKSELYSLVVALDFSENMLKQCNEFIKQENISDERLALVRADISRLPFVSGSIDAVHAGAAIHCWPSPACAVAEISRVLRPGGIFVASTFIADVLPPVVPVLRIGRPIHSRPSAILPLLTQDTSIGDTIWRVGSKDWEEALDQEEVGTRIQRKGFGEEKKLEEGDSLEYSVLFSCPRADAICFLCSDGPFPADWAMEPAHYLVQPGIPYPTGPRS